MGSRGNLSATREPGEGEYPCEYPDIPKRLELSSSELSILDGINVDVQRYDHRLVPKGCSQRHSMTITVAAYASRYGACERALPSDTIGYRLSVLSRFPNHAIQVYSSFIHSIML